MKYQVTTTGAYSPLWSPDGKQIFYIDVSASAGRLAAVDVRVQPSFAVSKAILFPIDVTFPETLRPYDIMPDGKRFLVLLPAAETIPNQIQALQLRLTLNWFEELKQRASSGK